MCTSSDTFRRHLKPNISSRPFNPLSTFRLSPHLLLTVAVAYTQLFRQKSDSKRKKMKNGPTIKYETKI